MTTQVKLYIEPDQEIRRFTLDNSATFPVLLHRVQQLVERDHFRMFWQDSEGDQVVCGSEDELTAARLTVKNPGEPLRIYVRPVNKTSAANNVEKKLHRHVTCDGCQGPVAGTRFKCLECADYDLCEKCQAAGTHSEHDMLVIRRPRSDDWKKFFAQGYGTRSAFGGAPGAAGASGPCGPRRHGACHGGHFGSEGPQSGGSCGRRHGPHGGPRGFMQPPPFWGPRGGFPYPPAFDQTVEMDVDVNRPIPEVIADVTKKVMDALQKAQRDQEAPPAKTQEQEEPIRSEVQEQADLVTATVVETVGQVAEVLQQMAVQEKTPSETENDWTHLQAESVEEEQTKVAQAPKEEIPSAPTRDDRVESALRAMEEMGFPTEGNLLRRLLQNYNGDIARVLDSIK